MILLVQFGIRQKFPRACLITPKFYCLSSFMIYHCLILKISQKGEKVVMKLPVGKSQWRKLRAFMVKVKKGIKTVLWGLRVLWSIRQKFWLPLKFYPQYSTNIYTVGIERVAHFYILEQLDWSTIKQDCKVHDTKYLEENIMHRFEN